MPDYTSESDTIQQVNVAKKGRHYLVDGKLVPSVTNVLGILDKPALKFWAAQIEREYVLDKLEGLPNATPDQLRAALGEKYAHQKRLKTAGDIGTSVHGLIMNELKSRLGQPAAMPEANENAELAFMAWEEWADKHLLEPIAVEHMLGSTRLGVGGTLDYLGHAVPAPGPDVPVYFDWKSSKRSKTAPNGIYPEAKIQVSVYRELGLEMGLTGDNAWAAVVRLPKSLDDPTIASKQLDVVWISPEEATSYARGFLSILDTWTFMKGAFA